MLYLDSVSVVQGLTIYRDYANPKLFYYLPRSPRLAREGGDPLFQLLIYRRDITDNPAFKTGDRLGGGFLTMTVDLGVPDATLQAAKNELARQAGGDVMLAPVPFERGAVRTTALGSTTAAPAEGAQDTGGPRFVEKILASGVPSMYGDNRAVFSMELSQEGALLMRASLTDPGASQVAVVYDLDFKGLLPAYQVKIKIHFQQSYQYLRSRFTLNTLWFKTDLDSEMEKLVKNGSIEISEVDYSGIEPAAAAQARDKLNSLAKELATWAFFKPALQPGTVLAVDRGQLVAADPTAAAAQVTAGFSQPLEALANSRGSVGGSAGPRLQGQSADDRNARAGGQDLPSGAAEPSGASTTPAPERSLTAVERWNQAGRPQAALMVRSLSQEEQQDIEYDLSQVSAVKRSIAPQGQIRMAAGDAQLGGRIKEVDLNSPFFERIAGTVTTSADLHAKGVSSMVVKLRYGVRDDGTAPKDTAEFVLTAPGAKSDYAFMMDRRFSMELEYQVVVNYQPGFALGDPATQAVSAWKRTTTRNLDIDPDEVAAVFPVVLTVAQVDWSAVSAIEASVEYAGAGPAGVNQATGVLTKTALEARFYIRPRDPLFRDYRVRTRYLFTVGEAPVIELPGNGARTFVLNQPTQLAVPIAVTALDPLHRFARQVVELAYIPASGQPEQQKLLTFTGTGDTQTWTLFRGSVDETPAYKYRVTQFAANGTQSRSEWVSTSERFLVVGDVYEAVLEVMIRMLVMDFRGANLLGARLRLNYPDAAPHSDATREIFFSAPSEPVKWTVPKRPGGGDSYEYTVTWIMMDGTQRTVGPRTTSDEELILHPAL